MLDIKILPSGKSAVWLSVFGVISALILASITWLLIAPFAGMSVSIWIALIIGEGALIIPAILYVRSRRYDFRATFRLKTPPKGTLLSALIIAISLQPLVDEFDRLLSKILPMPSFLDEYLQGAYESLKVEDVSSFILMAIGVVIIAGIVEEGLFRGILQKSFENENTPLRAVIISSAVFSIVHFSPQLLQIFSLGALLGYVALRTDSLYPSIVLHMVNNAIAVTFINIDTTDYSFYTLGNHVSPLIIVPALFIFGFTLRKFHSQTAANIIIENTKIESAF